MAKLGMNVEYIDSNTAEVKTGVIIADNGSKNKVYVTSSECSSRKWDVYPSNRIEEIYYNAVIVEHNSSKLYSGFLYNKKICKIFRQLPYRKRPDGWNVCTPMELLNNLQDVIEPVDIVGKDGKKYG